MPSFRRKNSHKLKKQTIAKEKGKKSVIQGIYTKGELCKSWEIIAAALLDAGEMSIVAVVSVSALKDKNYR